MTYSDLHKLPSSSHLNLCKALYFQPRLWSILINSAENNWTVPIPTQCNVKENCKYEIALDLFMSQSGIELHMISIWFFVEMKREDPGRENLLNIFSVHPEG